VPPEELQIRIYGETSKPTLIYLPGLHGDWTLITSFRKALGGRARFAEITYPRTLTWSLEDYATHVEGALAEKGITRDWLLGESFSSQVVWPLVAPKKFHTEGVILAGGFVRHPMQWGVRLADIILGGVSLSLLTRLMFGYAKAARFRYRHAPETLVTIEEFIARRTELDRQAATHRLRLVAQSDPRETARRSEAPVFALTGILDPIVPWPFVFPRLRRHCPALHDSKIIWQADHNVLGTAPQLSAEQVLRWMQTASK
jgi:pimeloyl-ACP methyl ester carboxylesterase